jgi:predicted phage baseplate assembly protein
MPLALPDLDTRRFAELVVEGRSRIPMQAPEWTDHNLSDPGIVLMELLAYLIETDVYRANRVPDRSRRKLLGLAGERLAGPVPGRAVIAVATRPGAPLSLPAGVGLTLRHGETVIRATTQAGLPLIDGTVRAVQVLSADAILDRSTRLATTRAVAALGEDPRPGDALVIGLDGPLPAGRGLALHLDLAGPDASDEDAGIVALRLDPTVHHGARTVWEAFDGAAWVPLADAAVKDPTRALSRPGIVVLEPATAVPPVRLGTVVAPLAWVRCRLAGGRPDRAPVLRAATANAVEVRLAAPAFSTLHISPGAEVPPAGVVAGNTSVGLAFDVDPASGDVTRLLAAGAEEAPAVAVLDYAPPAPGAPGRIALAAAWVGRGDGTPEQEFTIPGAPVEDDARVWLLETDGVHGVRLRESLDASGRRDRDAVLDPTTGGLRFGDGRRGRVPPAGSAVLAAWSATSAAAGGGLRPPAIGHLVGDARTRLLLGADPGAVDATLAVSLVTPVRGAADAEDVGAAAARAELRIWAHERLVEALEAARATTLDDLDPDVARGLAAPERAVTLADHERIAGATAGGRIDRARAFVDMHPDLPPELRAAGCVTVVVVPSLPAARPEPTPGLLDAVRRTLDPRRLVGTRVFVTGPTYVAVDVTATIALVPGAAADAATADVRDALGRFLHPLSGGAPGRGWPFGRPVYRSEIMQLIDAAAGVDHVEALTLAAAGDPPTCGNLAIGRTALVVAGTLTVAVVS